MENLNRHWCLVVTDNQSKAIFCFDSSHSESDTSYILQNVLTFFRQLQISDKFDLVNWVDLTYSISYPKQYDSFNCVVFIIFYVEAIMCIGIHYGVDLGFVDIDVYRLQGYALVAIGRGMDCLLLSNELIAIPKYYYSTISNKSEVVIASIKSRNMGKFDETLCQQSYKTLIGNEKLNSSVVDFCNATNLKDQFCFSIGETVLGLKPRFAITKKPVSVKLSQMSLIFMPYNESDHFSLFVVDNV